MIINVVAGNKDYDIVLEPGVLNEVGNLLNLNRKVMIVTDDGVPSEYAQTVADKCKEGYIHVIPHGEINKNINELQGILSHMLKEGFSRKDLVIAVGGGVVGDMSGFAASMYMRGVEFVNIPTTLLSQVDSSIGGKTAIDFDGIKNAIGAFYPPAKVIIDTNTLKTLDERQVHAGLAESIKMAATFDEELFTMIENCRDLDAELPEIIRRSLLIKKQVVEEDPLEAGLRKVLNFGHTVGHAIESYYAGSLLHGECVALGMLVFASDDIRARIKKINEKYELPVHVSAGPQELIPILLHDKKKQGDVISVVCTDKLGTFRFEDMHPDRIAELMEKNK